MFVARTSAAEIACIESTKKDTEIFSFLIAGGMQSLCSKLSGHMYQLNASPAVASHIKIELWVSCYASGTLSPTLENGVDAEESLIREFSSHSHSQRIVASNSFSRHENKKHGTIMVDNGEATPFQNSGSPVTPVWFAKCLFF